MPWPSVAPAACAPAARSTPAHNTVGVLLLYAARRRQRRSTDDRPDFAATSVHVDARYRYGAADEACINIRRAGKCVRAAW